MKKIALLGATGSIGTQTLDVIRTHRDEFSLVSMSVGQNIDKTREILAEFQPRILSVSKKEDYEVLKDEFLNITIVYGEEGLIEVATCSEADVVVTAVMGSVGLFPTIEAIRARKTIALANKETLVTAGHLVMKEAQEYGVSILPVDSEHSAIYQCLQGENMKEINRLIITASGGSFRDKTRQELEGVTVEEALNHPNWSMGAKITIDSATMMNKGLEVIEAHWLFNMPYEKIDVLLHKQSIIHSMVEFHDRSVMAQLGTPDMRVPIQYALTYPNRMVLPSTPLNLAEIGTLDFAKMDFERYRCLSFAFEAGKTGGTMPTVLNAANEQAVALFLEGKISFLQIEDVIEKALNWHTVQQNPCLQTIKEVDLETRSYVLSLIS
ncbi:1-deoxy-D-xylulose-5-phosphate reductoisomerase [Priestia filamentosa]|uniref:1-deoxy-D-xylulose 5-phosphate reductoisomerase n=1 Tax=Priestia filamentosa TaxID=1402861 RepID=A0A1X7D6Q2_9BACI|nr:1-deoxy-D-xylulose-5-phosphate reductoisomerase [Priestia filamentosa]AKO93811.1 1-deoxy-D-xylulose-5-phosphate reductoisomerase [Priestia filamentosa]MDT3764048.1 1-deoxy-D-xylulose-5-phosphate reductoisomerase [Priestia filamentosa]OXS71477.1 1-deoxy-D-xylulose-5-phosphate reductoisomerase [Priestia filamentosa]RJS67121.1 1-deoxy-D-xylulose-5-phosphate reductoisomerase [Priestia filamentosa]WCM14685.1 1-deoxy-D-xylulose-5-phosphate reductoisomerase [Priestia filamentosa]